MTPDADQKVEQEELSFTVVEMQDGTAILKDHVVVSYKTKHTPSIRPIGHIPGYLPK